MLSANYLMQANQNYSKFAHSPFRAPIDMKNSSILNVKPLLRKESASSSVLSNKNNSAARSPSVKEGFIKAEWMAKTETFKNFKDSSKAKDEKIPLPSLFADGVIYVSSKRYKRILKRREQRSRQKQ